MLIAPKERPVIANLNSYYVNVHRLIEHYQGELGSGGAHFRAATSEGLLFFDQDEILGGSFKENGKTDEGKAAIDRLIESLEVKNYVIDVFQIQAENLYFWANIHRARPLHQGLSTDFTDLGRLMKKMGAESLTGYVDVKIGQGEGGALVFFNGGKIVGGSFTGEDSIVRDPKDRLERLIREAGEHGATFDVSQLPLQHTRKKAQGPAVGRFQRRAVLAAVEDLLGRLETAAKRQGAADFKTLLNRKFIEVADSFDFLDPFAGEFQYADGKAVFAGTAPDQALLDGMLATVKGLAGDLGLASKFSGEIAAWARKHAPALPHLTVSP